MWELLVTIRSFMNVSSGDGGRWVTDQTMSVSLWNVPKISHPQVKTS